MKARLMLAGKASISSLKAGFKFLLLDLSFCAARFFLAIELFPVDFIKPWWASYVLNVQ
jgi:hypothetical protein